MANTPHIGCGCSKVTVCAHRCCTHLANVVHTAKAGIREDLLLWEQPDLGYRIQPLSTRSTRPTPYIEFIEIFLLRL